MSAWLLVAGDFTTFGGMDTANFALASYLSRQAREDVHIVAHTIAAELASQPRVQPHRVPRPFGRHRFGEPLMRHWARRWQSTLAPAGVRVVANGGNVDAGDVNWVHYVHAAFTPTAAGTMHRRRIDARHRRYVAEERAALARARVVICNSQRTLSDVVAAGVPRDRAHVVYYGIDAARFGAIDADERAAARLALALPPDRPLALFSGALGDRRKGFDTLFDAWRALCGRDDWDVDLVVTGAGAELAAWQARAAALGGGRIRFLGFRRDMASVFAASDVLVHPARYEAYGLAVHEALCRGLPAIVSAAAGVAERYPEDLGGLLLQDPESAGELVRALLAWRSDATARDRVAPFASRLRARGWDHMGHEIESIVQGAA